MNFYGVFILGVNIKYGLLFCFYGSKVAYTGERVIYVRLSYDIILFSNARAPKRIPKFSLLLVFQGAQHTFRKLPGI